MKILVADDDSTSAHRRDGAAKPRSRMPHRERRRTGLGRLPIRPARRGDQRLDDARADRARTVPQHRAHTPGGYTYFIMVTSQGGLDEILEGMGAGADDYLIKPLDSDDLQARLIAAARVTSLHRQLGEQRTELEGLNNELTAIARRDPLTGLRNRRALEEDLDLLEARVTRYGHRYCMALLDVDHFKSYNDTYGHQAGDRILQTVAAQLKDQARKGDALYRYGGEEFLCIFPEQSLTTGALAAERMRAGLNGWPSRTSATRWRAHDQRRPGHAGPRPDQIGE